MNKNRLCPSCNSGDSKTAYQVESFQIVKCKRCNLVYLLNPPEDNTLYDQYYSGNCPDPDDYCNNSHNNSLGELWNINAQRIKILKRLHPQGKLLDIGCGYGFFLKSAAEAGYSCEGIEKSKQAVDFSVNSLNANASASTIQQLTDEKKQFDIITLWHVLEHFPDPYTVLRMIRDLLTNNGICILEVPNLHSLKFILARNKWIGGNHPLYHRIFFTSSTLQTALKKAGFSQITRLRLSYSLPGRNTLYEYIKSALNLIAYDAFLIYAAWK